ncbi:MAG: hypothetical protein LBL91_00810 [Lachnospiraceae bacterium]|jgi:hypothetical protein|nr:hypothetical protein [Lachnospiraceae bacterium]
MEQSLAGSENKKTFNFKGVDISRENLERLLDVALDGYNHLLQARTSTSPDEIYKQLDEATGPWQEIVRFFYTFCPERWGPVKFTENSN